MFRQRGERSSFSGSFGNEIWHADFSKKRYKPQISIASYMGVYESGGSHSESSAAYVLWPRPAQVDATAPHRASYFGELQKTLPQETNENNHGRPKGPQARCMADLITIRAVHCQFLRRNSFGSALGYRIRDSQLTDMPAIIVFVSRKVHMQWLLEGQLLPTYLEGPEGMWCDVDVVEFSYGGGPMATPKEQIYTSEVEGLRGNFGVVGPGSQVASQETYGTLGGLVRSKNGGKHIGFITNRHVAVDLDYPFQKMYHPLPPNLGPGVYLGAVERAVSFISDDLWYGLFASRDSETFVRVDGAFVPFAPSFDLARLSTDVPAVGEMGDVFHVDLRGNISDVVGLDVVKVGRSSGPTNGKIMAYGLQYSDEKGIYFLTDFLIIGDGDGPFDLEGDSGSIVATRELDPSIRPRPLGMVWGGTSNRGRLKFTAGKTPVNWTSVVDLGRLLNVLHLDLLTSNLVLEEAQIEQQCGWNDQDYAGYAKFGVIPSSSQEAAPMLASEEQQQEHEEESEHSEQGSE